MMNLIGGDQYVTGEVPYFVTVPTTSGTGSEIGRSAIISKTIRIASGSFLAEVAGEDRICGPVANDGTAIFCDGGYGMDALTHNLEAYLAKMYHPMCEGIALEGIELINRSLVQAVLRPDVESRSIMMIGSLMGAVAFQRDWVSCIRWPIRCLLCWIPIMGWPMP